MTRYGEGLVLITVALLCLGVVMVNSAGAAVGRVDLSLAELVTGRTALFAAIALGMLLLGSSLPVEALLGSRSASVLMPALLLAIVGTLLLVHVPGIGREVNGAWRWIAIGPIGFQPSEVAKWGLLPVLAWYATRRVAMDRLIGGFLVPMSAIGVVCVLIGTEDLGTAVLVGAVGTALLVAAGARLRHVLWLLPVALLTFVIAVVHSPYRLGRLRAFLDPFGDPRGAGYHMVQSMAAVSGGGLAGRGLGNSVQKFGYLPEDTTDFVFAIIAEELGLAGPALVVGLYVGVLLLGFAIVAGTTRARLRLLGLGILLTIGLQTVINLAVVTGCGPTKGIALPLVSSGGTGWVLTAFSVGVLVAIDGGERKAEAA